MPSDDPGTTDRPRTSRARLRRSGRQLVRAGAVLVVVSLVLTLVAGFMTRSMISHLQTNSAELLDGSASVTLQAGAERTLYVTGGLVAPGELVPTPVEQISCTITGPDGQPVAFDDRTADRSGIDFAVARIQVVGHFSAESDGEHLIACDGLGVMVSPELSPAAVVARLGGLALGSLGTILGVTMLVIGGVLLLLRREDDEDTAADEEDLPPEEGADEWWEQNQGEPETAEPDEGGDAGVGDDDTDAGDDYVELTEEQLAAFTDEELEELVNAGVIVFEEDDGYVGGTEDGADDDPVDGPDNSRA